MDGRAESESLGFNTAAQDASYLNATAKKKNAEAMAKKYGVDVKDPVALKKKLAELNALRERWKNPYSDGALMDEIRNAWRAREGADVPEGAAASVAELPSERLFREYAAREWQTERTDYSFTDDDGKLHNLSRAYATDAQGNRLGQNVYITTPNGNLDWYRFPQDKKTQGLLAKHGVKDLPIRLKVGKQESQEHRGFGFMHILNHYDDFMNIGESPLLHLYNTLSNLVKIRGGYGGRYQFKSEYEGGRDSMLIAQLLEEEGCYSMISCYPTQMNRSPLRGELVIGRVLFQFIPSSGENQILAGKMRNKATASSVYASGQVSAGNMPQKLATVNIYDVRIKDKDGEFFRQQYEPTVHFSAIGPNSKTWDKYPDSRKFKGRDDGKLRVEIDASQAKLKNLGVSDEYAAQEAGMLLWKVDSFVESLPAEKRALLEKYIEAYKADYPEGERDAAIKEERRLEEANKETLDALHAELGGMVDRMWIEAILPGVDYRDVEMRTQVREYYEKNIKLGEHRYLHINAKKGYSLVFTKEYGDVVYVVAETIAGKKETPRGTRQKTIYLNEITKKASSRAFHPTPFSKNFTRTEIVNPVTAFIKQNYAAEARKGSVSDLLVIILGSIRFHEVKSLNVRLRIRSVIKNAFLQFYKHSKWRL